MRSAAIVVSLLVLSALGPGCRGDREKCASAAQHFAELVYWDRVNAEIAAMPPERRENARKQALLDYEKELDSQLQLRISTCVAAGADSQADCINASKTAAEALKCADIAKGRDSKSGCCEAGGAPATSSALAALLGLVLLRRRRARS